MNNIIKKSQKRFKRKKHRQNVLPSVCWNEFIIRVLSREKTRLSSGLQLSPVGDVQVLHSTGTMVTPWNQSSHKYQK